METIGIIIIITLLITIAIWTIIGGVSLIYNGLYRLYYTIKNRF